MLHYEVALLIRDPKADVRSRCLPCRWLKQSIYQHAGDQVRGMSIHPQYISDVLIIDHWSGLFTSANHVGTKTRQNTTQLHSVTVANAFHELTET